MILFRTLLIVLLFILPLFASGKTKVFILHSYSQEYQWTKNQHNSFISTIEASEKTFEFYTEYLDTKRLQLTPKYTNEVIEHIRTKYAKISPDIVYTTDDNALNFIYKNYSKLYDKSFHPPVFFSGVNNLMMDELLPKNLYRGIYEIKEVKQNIELIKQFSPQTRDIYIIGDSSKTYLSIEENIKKQEKNYSNIKFHYISHLHLSKVLNELNSDATKFAILTTIGNFKDEHNSTMLPKESIKKLKELNNLIILTMEDAYMNQGIVGGYATSAHKQGTVAANLALEYLKTKSLEHITSVKSDSNVYIFDATELVQARILLSEYIRRSSIIINQQKDFIDRNKLIILEILTIIFLVIIFALTVTYAIQRKKHSIQMQKILEMNELKNKLEIQENLLHHITKEENLAFWSLDLQSDALYLSQELIDKLQIEIDIYKDDKDLMSYFIHFNDKKLFFQKIKEIQEIKTHLYFHHQMINSHNELFGVKHILYYETLHDGSSSKIIGVLKFEEQ